MREEQIAIIDLGTNTFHLLIVELTSHHHYLVREKFKETVALGEGGLNEHVIKPPAFERGMQALLKFSKIIESRKITKILATATAAIRNAHNGIEFVEKAKEISGISIRIISGNEEAALIYQGVRFGLNLPTSEDVLIVDIGGGSVEFIIGNKLTGKLMRSAYIGAAKALEMIRPSDPITNKQIAKMIEFFELELGGMMAEMKEFNVKTLIGSSGTFETLGALILGENGEKKIDTANNMNGFSFDTKKFKKLYKKIIGSSRQERLQLQGMDPVRVDMIVAGSILVNYLVENLNLEKIMVSSFSLKEGILCDYIEQCREQDSYEEHEKSSREKTIHNLGERFDYKIEHVQLVCKLALSMFDQLRQYHSYGVHERELLSYAAILHDIGHFINHSGHHKHSQYIILNSGLPGFTTHELILLSNICRYHRKSLPSLEHLHYNLLYKEDKERVNKLAGILRIAVNLDRAYRALVSSVTIKMEAKQCIFQIQASAPISIELEATQAASTLFEQAFGVKTLIVPSEYN